MMMQKKFLPELEKLDLSSKQDEEEKERLIMFFNENILFFNVFIKFSSSMHTAVQKELKLYVEKKMN